jgi:uridine kinase
VRPDHTAVLGRVREALSRSPRVLVAVDGADGAGKSRWAAEFVPVARDDLGVPVEQVSVDAFHHPRTRRYARGRDDPDGFYLDSFDLDALVRQVLLPWRTGGSWVDAVHDVVTDEPVRAAPRPVPDRGVLVVDGLFLLRPELAHHWHVTVRLEAPATVRVVRLASRDGTPADPGHPYYRRYLLAQDRYAGEVRPAEVADVVIDTGAHRAPEVRRGH